MNIRARQNPSRPVPQKPRDVLPKGTIDRLASALADHTITSQEWESLEPELRRSQAGSKDARSLLEAYHNSENSFEQLSEFRACLTLQGLGYQVPAPGINAAGVQERPPFDLKAVVDGNVAEIDTTFEELYTKLGSQQNVLISVVDGGFTSHPLLNDHLANEKDAKTKLGKPVGKRLGRYTKAEREEGMYHGTHVAGIAVRGTNKLKLDLVSVPINTLTDAVDQREGCTKNWIPEALDQAGATGAKVVNVSIEAFPTEHEFAEFRSTFKKYSSVLFVVGSGNEGQELTPAYGSLAGRLRLPNLAVVAASTPDGAVWPHSNWSNTCVDLAARGVDVSSAAGRSMRPQTGTSMAAPNVTNLAAKCLALDPSLTPPQVVELMRNTSEEHKDWEGSMMAKGPVNPKRAMEAAALGGLTKQGMTLKAAARRLGLSEKRLQKLRSLVPS